MADATWAAFSSENAAPHLMIGTTDFVTTQTTEPDGIHEVGLCAFARGEFEMTSKPDPKEIKKQPAPHPGMMGDGTEEQNLGQPGNPAARIKKDEVDAAFTKDTKKT